MAIYGTKVSTSAVVELPGYDPGHEPTCDDARWLGAYRPAGERSRITCTDVGAARVVSLG